MHPTNPLWPRVSPFHNPRAEGKYTPGLFQSLQGYKAACNRLPWYVKYGTKSMLVIQKIWRFPVLKRESIVYVKHVVFYSASHNCLLQYEVVPLWAAGRMGCENEYYVPIFGATIFAENMAHLLTHVMKHPVVWRYYSHAGKCSTRNFVLYKCLLRNNATRFIFWSRK